MTSELKSLLYCFVLSFTNSEWLHNWFFNQEAGLINSLWVEILYSFVTYNKLLFQHANERNPKKFKSIATVILNTNAIR